MNYVTGFVFAWLSEGQHFCPFADIKILPESPQSVICLSDQKAVIRMEKDKARMAQVFLELDEDADGL